MKFKKILAVGIDESALDTSYWKKIDSLTDKRIHLSKDSSNIRKELRDTDCLLVNFGINVTREDINSAPNLKYIGTLSTAFGKIDTAYARKKKIIVSNLAGYSTESVAEFTIAVILEHIRNLEEGKKRGRAEIYSESGISAVEIKDKFFGIIGLGNIGNRIAELALGFGAYVKYWSRRRKKGAEKREVKYESLDDIVKNVDFLSINLAQNKETEGILTGKRIQDIKKGAVIVNTAPMELIDIEALLERLKRNDITFILDHSDEMSSKDLKRLSKFKNCIIYPPIAYVSKEAARNKKEMFTSNIINFLRGTPKNVVH